MKNIMKFLKFQIIILTVHMIALFFTGSSAIVQLTRDEIVALQTVDCGAGCQYWDGSLDDLKYNYCECNPLCAEYNTCCVDSPSRNSSINIKQRTREECVGLDVGRYYSGYVFMITKCDPNSRVDRAVVEMCHRDYQKDQSDLFVRIPAVDNESNTTYKNFFCGLCNGVDSNHLTLWDTSIVVEKGDDKNDIIEENIEEKLFYDETSKKWVYMDDSNDNFVYGNVELRANKPSASRFCVPNLISDCDPGWVDATVEEQCKAYMHAIYVISATNDTVRMSRYRNIHCAICNFQDISASNIWCREPNEYDYGDPIIKLPILLDVNLKDGNKVGKVNKCRNGELFDPWFKKCKRVVCGIPGYVLRNNKCVKA